MRVLRRLAVPALLTSAVAGAVLVIALTVPTGLFFALLFAVSAVAAGGFAIRLGPPWRNPDPAMTWLQSSLAWVAVAWDATWALVALAVPVPISVFAVLLLVQDGIFGWRWWVLEASRRRPNEGSQSRLGSSGASPSQPPSRHSHDPTSHDRHDSV